MFADEVRVESGEKESVLLCFRELRSSMKLKLQNAKLNTT
jgi:hypothetical protein